jgi:hypothetical protein
MTFLSNTIQVLRNSGNDRLPTRAHIFVSCFGLSIGFHLLEGFQICSPNYSSKLRSIARVRSIKLPIRTETRVETATRHLEFSETRASKPVRINPEARTPRSACKSNDNPTHTSFTSISAHKQTNIQTFNTQLTLDIRIPWWHCWNQFVAWKSGVVLVSLVGDLTSRSS